MTNAAKLDCLLLTASQVAELLGVSVRHLWRMADSGHFPRPFGLGSKLKRWSRKTVEAWVAEQTTKLSPRR